MGWRVATACPKPDLIILDMMPAMDVEFSRRLRQNQQFKDTP